jgi:hypothetical protein
MNVSDDHKPDEKHDPKKASKNTVLKAVVYAREIIIPNLGHFEDYNINHLHPLYKKFSFSMF